MRRSAGINTAFRAIKAQHASNRSAMEVLADRMIGFASSTPFLVTHAILFVGWIYWNLPFSGLTKFDPYPYSMLTTIVSLEAIFLSTFILISQNHETRLSERRNQLDLQVNLLTEQENTKMLKVLERIADKVGANTQDDPSLQVLEQSTRPEKLVEQIEEATEKTETKGAR